MNDPKKGWFSAGSHPELWGGRGAYQRVAYERLPALERTFRGSFDGSNP